MRYFHEVRCPSPNAKGLQKLDEETIEGLSNLAHGLPQISLTRGKGQQCPAAVSRSSTGKKQPESVRPAGTPAEGFSQVHGPTPADRSLPGPSYRKRETAEAHLVHLPAWNKALQGTISQLDPKTKEKREENFELSKQVT